MVVCVTAVAFVLSSGVVPQKIIEDRNSVQTIKSISERIEPAPDGVPRADMYRREYLRS